MGPRLAKPPAHLPRELVPPDADGKFLWPGYGENVRVLKWMVERIRGGGRADETPIGFVPADGALDITGLDVTPAQLREALRCDAGEWLAALDDLGEFYGRSARGCRRRSRGSSRRRGGSSAADEPTAP